MRLRQVATVARDLETVVDDLCGVLGLEVAYRDPGVAEFGLTNAVMAIGDTFLEVVAPNEQDTAAGRYLDKAGGAAGYMVILQTEGDMEEFRERMTSIGVRSVWRADHDDIQGTHLHPRDVGGAILSVDRAMPASSWRWAGPEWESKRRTDVATEIVGAELSSAQPATMARRWGEILERSPHAGPGDSFEITLDRGSLRFRKAVNGCEGVTGIEVRASDLEHVMREAFDRRLERGPNRVHMGGVDFLFQ